MDLSREAKIVSGITLLVIPTIMFGGLTLLGILTTGMAGISPGKMVLNGTQSALFRAGHAHAGVWVALSLVIQVLLDSATLSAKLKWLARIAAPLAAVGVSGGFFGLAYSASFKWLLYLGAVCLVAVVLLTGIGLLRRPDVSEHRVV
jgi:hypothetical protein